MAKPDNTLKRKQREEKENAEDGLKFVIDGAKLKCDLCTVPEGDLKVNYDTPTIQDKKVATVVEKDKKSVIFKGNCKKSPNSSSPCASVMKLAEWKDVGTVYFQEKFPLLLKSTIKCEYGGVAIKITDCAQRNEIKNLDVTGAPVPGYAPDFTIKFELDKTENTIVPFGILDFEKKIENQFFRFKYSLKESNIDAFYFEIISESGDLLYENNWLKPVIINNETKEKLFKSKKTSHIPMVSAERPVGSPDLEPKNYTTMGSYIISWDGFDSNGIYDSTRFNGKDLKAKITAIKNGMQKSIVVDFSTKYSQVDWADVKIDKKSKRIDVTLRVNLKDGGAKGLDCSTYTIDTEASYETFTPTTGVDPLAGTKITTCDWDKVPAKVISAYGNSLVKARTKTFDELKKYVLEGLNHYWSRNSSRGKNVILDGIAYEVFVNAINETDRKKSMDDIPLVYHTNGAWGRSGNPASLIVNTIPDTGMVQQISYNTGYIKRFSTDHAGLDGWIFQTEIDKEYPYGKNQYDAISDFKETAAHEIGHEILYAFSNATFSWQHKGSSYLNQETKIPEREKSSLRKIAEKIPLAPYIPVIKPIDFMQDSKGEYYPKAPNEIDLMKYYNIIYTTNPKINALPDLSRTIASENDVLSLIWLTKIKMKL